MRHSFIICFCLSTQVLCSQIWEGQKKIDSLFLESESTNKPGGVIAVLRGNEVIYKTAIGLANIAHPTPNSFEHQYDLASIAKQFTAICIALLEEQGKVSSEDLLSKYYPQFKLPQGIKIKNLLDHTSGIREAYVLATLSGKINLKGELRHKFNTKKYLLKVLSKESDLNFPAGSELAYTNINYILLADIVEKVSGQAFHKFADSAIFKPLGMAHTFYRHQPKMTFPNEATGYLVKGKKYKAIKARGGILGDGKLVSTIDDLIKWENNLRHNQLGNSGQLLVEKLYTSSKLNSGVLTHYGYGFWINDYRGLKTINHGGDDGRFTSFILKFPEKDLVIIALANSSLYNNTQSTTYQIADILLSKEFTSGKSIAKSYQSIELPIAELESKVGIYKRIDERGLAQLRRTSLIGDSLFISSSYYSRGLRLQPVEHNFFVGKNRVGNQLTFSFKNDSSGTFFEEQFLESKPRRFDLIPMLKNQTSDFVGTFVNESTRVRLKLKRKGSRLIAKKGIIRIPLIGFDEDQFYAYQNDALLIFERDEFKKVSRLKINASDFRNFILIKEK